MAARRHSTAGTGGIGRSNGRSKTSAVILWAMAGAHVANAVRLRRRNAALAVVEPQATDAAADAPSAWRAITSTPEGAVDPAPQLLPAIERHAEQAGLDVVDVVPRGSSIESSLALLARVNPADLAAKPFSSPGGAGHLVVARNEVVDRVDLASDTPTSLELRGLTRELQRAAPLSAGVVVTEALAPNELTPTERWRWTTLRTRFAEPYRRLSPMLLAGEGAHLAVMGLGTIVNPIAGAAALGTWWAQPLLVFGGVGKDRGLRPARFGTDVVLRPVAATRRWAQTVQAALAARRDDADNWASGLNKKPKALRPPVGVDLFEARRSDCAWCGSERLEHRLTTPDLLQHKPGTFTLDECADCGHIFQNPRLAPAGLDFYYSDFYDGMGGEMFSTFNSAPADFKQRLAFITPHVTPKAWLDVGGGAGHFCLYAKGTLPDTTFGCLDLSDGVLAGERRGWIDQGHHGTLSDLVSEVEGKYDTLSLFHCLEHTPEPHRELDAATKVLSSGGHLLIELPNPGAPGARAMGRYWFPWFQPQHLHFITADNLVSALEERGFDILAVDRRVTADYNAIGAVILWFHDKVPSTTLPWLQGETGRRWTAPAYMAALPFAVVGSVVLDVASRLLRRNEAANASAYRVLARKR